MKVPIAYSYFNAHNLSTYTFSHSSLLNYFLHIPVLHTFLQFVVCTFLIFGPCTPHSTCYELHHNCHFSFRFKKKRTWIYFMMQTLTVKIGPGGYKVFLFSALGSPKHTTQNNGAFI